MRWWSASLSLVVAAMLPATAGAEPIELVSQQEQFMLFNDAGGTIENGNFFSRDPFLSTYGDIESGFLASHDDDSQFIIIYTTWTLPAGVGALYQAVANDVEGVGYEHIAPLDAVIPEPFFDDTPDSQVYGFMHMNRWTQYLGADDGLDDRIISLIFGQEFGHAWLAFVHLEHPELSGDGLLGRSDAHWNFYMQTGGSPVEGHEWVDNGDGTFTALKNSFYTFSDLDLYLMGLLPAEDVAPWFVIEDPFNCVDSALEGGECAPKSGFRFEADSYTVNGTRVDVTVDDVIASEGARVPAFGDAPDTWDVSFLLIKSPDEEIPPDELALMDSIVARSIEIFNDQTRGMGKIVNRTAGEPPTGTTDTGNESDDGPNPPTSSGPGESDGTSASGPNDESGGSSGGSGSGGEVDDDGGGCGCAAGQRPSLALLAMFAGLLCRRRRD